MPLPIIALIAGLILWIPGAHWFSHAGTVGEILTLVSGALILLGVVMLLLVGTVFHKANKDFDRFHRRW